MKFICGQKYRIVGLGTLLEDEKCVISNEKTTGYIDVCGEMIPVNLKLFGPGLLGEFVELQQLHS